MHQVPAERPPLGILRFRALMICSGCEEGVIGIFDYASRQSRQSNNMSPLQCTMDPRTLGWNLATTYPQPALPKCPDFTPDELKRVFLQAANALRRRDPDASGAMSRKVVDISTQRLLGEESKKFGTINARIEALAAKGTLTPDLKEWAHEVRLGGNDAAHDLDPFTNDEADELLDFAELYLTYVYTLPNRLKVRRERAAQEKAAKAIANSS